MTFPSREESAAAGRVRDYLDHLPLMGGIDHEQIHAIGVAGTMHYLYASDLQTLVEGIEVRELG